MRRKVPLANGSFYHAFNRSIAGFEIFRFREEYQRMTEAMRFYRTSVQGQSFSLVSRSERLGDPGLHGPARVRVIAYCLMPTHIHLFLEQLKESGVEEYMRYVTGGYAMYFNQRAERKGPLWESRFQVRCVETDSYALHLSRYIHLNPTSAGLVEKAEDWEFSSYQEHLGISKDETLCDFRKILSLSPEVVRKFTQDRTDYQRSLQILKAYLFD